MGWALSAYSILPTAYWSRALTADELNRHDDGFGDLLAAE
jgi:hypothetical protein